MNLPNKHLLQLNRNLFDLSLKKVQTCELWKINNNNEPLYSCEEAEH